MKKIVLPKNQLLYTHCLLILLSFGIYGCGADNMSDATTRKKDIERESAAQLSQDYEQVAGDYVSEISESEYEVKALLQIIRVQRDGNVVPQPTITGNLTIKEPPSTNEQQPTCVDCSSINKRSRLDLPIGRRVRRNTEIRHGNSEPETVIPFSGGVYDPASGDLAIRISGFSAPGANISCKVKLPKIKCQWVPVGSGVRFRFSLQKTV